MTLARGEIIRFSFVLTDHLDKIDETDIRYRMNIVSVQGVASLGPRAACTAPSPTWVLGHLSAS